MKTIGKTLIGIWLLTTLAAHAQILTVVHDFSAFVNSTNSDGANFYAPLLPARDGSLYGAAASGGTNGAGTIFKCTPGGGFTVVHTFTANANPYGTNADGAYPEGGLVQDTDGNFYGTTTGGGAYGNYGTVFKMTAGGILTTLHSFNYSDGENSGTALTPAGGGTFYGVIPLGGANSSGSIFRVNTNGTFQSLHDFALRSPNAASVYTNFDGAEPYGTLLSGGDGYFYGTTEIGGTNGNGTVFRFNTNNGAFDVLHTFGAVNGLTNADGINPLAGLTLFSNGVFWGTATFGGTNGNGTIFQITTGGVFTVLHTFNINTDGSAPSSSLLRGRDGNFYGTAEYGTYWSGIVYQFTTNRVLTPLHFFNQLNIPQSNYGWDGANPYAGVSLGSDGYLYGTTVGDGANTNGTIFRLIYPGLAIANLPGKKVLISWPTNQAGFTLQVNTNLTAANWLTASPAPAVLNDQFVVTNDAAVPKSFYRLKK
jgi:uncharacterized repeat protein (TIGR03803 family)